MAERKKSAADSAHKKEIEALAKSAEEQARLAKAAADAEPAAQQDIQQLMHLPLSQINMLPQEQKEQVWHELARQMTEQLNLPQNLAQQLIALPNLPAVVDGMEALAAAARIAVSTFNEALKPIMQDLIAPESIFADALASSVRPLTERIARAAKAITSEETQKAMKIWADLAPYITAEAKDHPELYGDEAADDYSNADDLMRAAIRRARADGVDIPLLKVELPPPERQAEQLTFHIDLPTKGKEDSPAAIIEKLRKMPTLYPRTHVVPNNALMNAMQEGAINAGELALIVAAATKRSKEITAYTIIDYDPGDSEITITDPKITEYERNVSNAIVSLWVEAEKLGVEPVFTTDAIYRAMPGGGETASPQQRGAITRAVEKFRRIHMTIDATDELRKRHAIEGSDTFKIDEYYFQMTRAKRTSKHSGQSVTAYKLTEKPVVLKYAEMTRQILSVQAKHLTIRKIDRAGRISTELVTMNADRQAITGYMMRRIAVMKHDLETARDSLKQYNRRRDAFISKYLKDHPGQTKQQAEQAAADNKLAERTLASFRRQSNTILFDTLSAVTDTATDNREQARRNREFCFDVLEYWKATGFIKGYSTQNQGRKITGIMIEI